MNEKKQQLVILLTAIVVLIFGICLMPVVPIRIGYALFECILTGFAIKTIFDIKKLKDKQ